MFKLTKSTQQWMKTKRLKATTKFIFLSVFLDDWNGFHGQIDAHTVI